uniref:Molybdopterin biosynthesis protein n=1 Tax=Hommersandiophycus borowitzkae TaxID=268573 RepID=A0A1G4NUC5_9FLOR|nr:Molybdopterin biosynthesis protein [Hommersandiophycus borowitzkae]SCW22247.1 Molybdopterin biosynthesis protein [Hommersandiophycus borowitzkae]
MNLNHTVLNQEEYEIYAKHIVVPEIQIYGQERLKQGRILCIGAGGLASASLLYLVSNGIGHIGIIDNDIIEKSNLHRQILYQQKDVGQYKTIIAKTRLDQLNPLCNFEIFNELFNESNAYQIVKKYDIIIDNTDNFRTRLLISQVCYQLHKIHIYGAISTFTGQVSVFNYQGGPTYLDLNRNYNTDHNTCNNEGVLGILPGIIGILQATETLKLLLGIGTILNGKILTYNLLTNTFRTSYLRHIININPKLLRHERQYKTQYINIQLKHHKQISLSTFYQIMQDNQAIYLIDVREKKEYEFEHLFKAINIPLSVLHISKNQEMLKKRSSESHLIIYCSSSIRSYIAGLLLGHQAISYSTLQV